MRHGYKPASFFMDSKECFQYIFDLKYAGVSCPVCKRSGAFYFSQARKCFICSCGRYSIFPRKGTLFDQSRIPLPKWILFLEKLSSGLLEPEPASVMNLLGVSIKAAHIMLSKTSRMMHAHLSREQSAAVLENMKEKVHRKHRETPYVLERLYIEEFLRIERPNHRDLFTYILDMAIVQPQ